MITSSSRTGTGVYCRIAGLALIAGALASSGCHKTQPRAPKLEPLLDSCLQIEGCSRQAVSGQSISRKRVGGIAVFESIWKDDKGDAFVDQRFVFMGKEGEIDVLVNMQSVGNGGSAVLHNGMGIKTESASEGFVVNLSPAEGIGGIIGECPPADICRYSLEGGYTKLWESGSPRMKAVEFFMGSDQGYVLLTRGIVIQERSHLSHERIRYGETGWSFAGRSIRFEKTGKDPVITVGPERGG